MSAEEVAEGGVGGTDAQVPVQGRQWLMDILNDLIQGELVRMNVDEHEDGAFDAVLAGAVGADTHGKPAALAILDVLLDGDKVIDDFSNLLIEVGDDDGAVQVTQSAANVRGDEVEDLFGHGGEAADGEIRAEHDDGHVDVGEEVGQVVVDLAELGVAILQFLVEGGQFLVGGLQLFLGGFQLLVGALEFLVAGLNFLVGRFELLVGGFLFLDDGLERFAGGGEFPAELAKFSAFGHGGGLAAAGRFLTGLSFQSLRAIIVEDDEEKSFAGGGEPKRNHFKVDEFRGALFADNGALVPDGSVLFERARNSGAQIHGQAFPDHFQEVKAGGTGGMLEEMAGATAKIEDVHVQIDDHSGRREAAEDEAVGIMIELRGLWFGRDGLTGGRG